MKRAALAAVLLLVWLAACERGCAGCGGQSMPLAVLLEVNGGPVERERATQRERWEAALVGNELQTDDELRTDARTSAKLRLADGAELWLRPSSQVRFLRAAGPDEQNIELVAGEALLKTAAKELHLRTHEGVATVRGGGALRLTRAGAALQLHLQVGEASFRRTDGEDVPLARGERVRVEIGAAVIRAATDFDAAPLRAAGLRLAVAGPGVRTRSSGRGDFTAVAPGELALPPDSELALAEGASTALMRELDRVQLFGAGEYRIGHGESLVGTRNGTLHVAARSRDVHIAVPGGFIVARAADGGSDCELRVDAHEGLVRVTHGEVTWNAAGHQMRLTPGEPFHWSIEERAGEGPDSMAESPKRVSFKVRAGESFVVHAAEVPVALALMVQRPCPDSAVVELNGGTRYRGDDSSVALWLGEAVRSYAVRCTSAERGPVVARGAVRVLRDTGTRELPPLPPTSLVDTDGHSYTIYYQNQLPDIRVRWPNPPVASSYQLDVDGRVVSTAAPEHTFTSGALRDGPHRLTYAANERRSRTANVEVRFDNTTTTASLSAPADRGFAPGAEVEIEGVALPTWKVSVDGGTIQKLGDDRFHGRIVTTESQPDFAVRLSHPRLGTHYYLRRASGSP